MKLDSQRMNNEMNRSADSSLLLEQFNNRDESALGKVYELYYRELNYFAKQLYRDTKIVAEDVIHDIFIKIWESKTIQFKKLDNIKAYIYISIKNGFLDSISHNKCVDKYNNTIIKDERNFVTEMVESETLSILSIAIDLLPKDIAAVFQLIAEGWEMKDIAKELNISKSSAYAKKIEATTILKNKLPKNLYTILLTISSL